MKSYPAGIAAHDFDNHDAMMAGSGRVNLIDGFGGGHYSGVKAEGDFRAVEVIIDGFGYAHEGQAFFGQAGGAGHGAISADADDGVDTHFPGIIDTVITDIGDFFLSVKVHRELAGIGLIAGAEDRAALGKDIADIFRAENTHMFFDQAEETILDAQYGQAIFIDGGFGNGPDDGVEAGAVTPAGQNADGFDLGFRGFGYRGVVFGFHLFLFGGHFCTFQQVFGSYNYGKPVLFNTLGIIIGNWGGKIQWKDGGEERFFAGNPVFGHYNKAEMKYRKVIVNKGLL
jgi:hypothetical protein